jgi:hypothetical protein
VTIEDDVDWIKHRWEHLTTSRFIGTPRPWRQPPPRKRYDGTTPESSGLPVPDPLHLDTHDLIHHILRKARHLAVVVAGELHQHQVLSYLQHHRSTHPAEELDYVLRNHHKVSAEVQATAERTISRIRARMTESFSEIFDGQRLTADCPWCRQQELRIRLIGPPNQQQPVVVCENDGCNPSQAECGKWWRGHPAWPFHEWEWLAQRIGA